MCLFVERYLNKLGKLSFKGYIISLMSNILPYAVAIILIVVLITGLVIIIHNAFKIRATMHLLKKKIRQNRRSIKSLTIKLNQLPDSTESKHANSFMKKFEQQDQGQSTGTEG